MSNMFFEFRSKLVMTSVQAEGYGLKVTEYLNQYNNLIKGDYENITFPVVFKQAFGKKYTDILDTGRVNLFLISDRLKKILEENELTGWKTFPIKLYDKKDNEIFGYNGFSITGYCDPIDYSKSEIIEKKYASNGPIVKFYKGKFFDLNSWNGTNFFSPRGKLNIFIDKKTADLLKKNKITNLNLINLAEAEVDVKILDYGEKTKET